MYKNGNPKDCNLLNDIENESSKFATRKWYIINDQNSGQYGRGIENDATIKFETKVIKLNLCDYSDAYILVTGDIKVAGNYSDNYADSFGSLCQFKRDESPMNGAGNLNKVALDNSTSFKYKASLLGKANDADGNDRSLKNTKIVVPLKYLSNFFRSLEMPLINCKIHLALNSNNNCVMYGPDTYAGGDNANNREATLQITSTLSNKDNENLTKQLNEGFKRLVSWNEYKNKT